MFYGNVKDEKEEEEEAAAQEYLANRLDSCFTNQCPPQNEIIDQQQKR